MDQYQFTRVIRRNLLIFAEILLADFLESLAGEGRKVLDKPDGLVQNKNTGFRVIQLGKGPENLENP